MTTTCCAATTGATPAGGRGAWPKQRILFLLAGSASLLGAALSAVDRRFLVIPAAVGANQLLMVATGWCPVSGLLDRVLPATAES